MFPEGMVFVAAARKLVLQSSSDGLPKQECIPSPIQASDLKRYLGILNLGRSLGRDARSGLEQKTKPEKGAIT